jgi:hypothetical protein
VSMCLCGVSGVGVCLCELCVGVCVPVGVSVCVGCVYVSL